METLNNWLGKLSNLLWGPWLLILLVGTGVWLTISLRGIQFRLLVKAFSLIFRRDANQKGDISHFGALMISLAATVGVGNIAGVATAVSIGGPGAVVWMWVTAFFGMATKYSEAFLAVRFREKNPSGEISGGPMYYLKNGLNAPRLAFFFALFGTLASFGIGNMVQANSTTEALSEVLSLSKTTIGVTLAFLTGCVLLGGVKRIAKVVSFFVPIMVCFYILGSLIILWNHKEQLPQAIAILFDSAMSGHAAQGGFVGAVFADAVRYGVARGLFSNESGLGSAPIAAAAAKTDQPGTQALVSMTGTFLDTLIVCSLTGLVLTTTGVWDSGETGAKLTLQAFQVGLPEPFGQWILSFAVATFAFSTILGWSYYGEKCFEYLTGQQYIRHFRVFWTGIVFMGAVVKLELVWNFSDVMNALMAVPNLIGLILLSGLIARETREYEKTLKRKNLRSDDV